MQSRWKIAWEIVRVAGAKTGRVAVNRAGRSIGLAACIAAAIAIGSAAPARAGDANPTVGLDDLLQLPTGLDLEPTSRGRFTKAEWREKFDEARAELAAAEAALAETQGKIADAAGETSAWKVATPGLGGVDPSTNPDTPLDFGLANEMRRNREEVARSKRRLEELEIEANLASVPEAWRGTSAPAGDPGSPVDRPAPDAAGGEG